MESPHNLQKQTYVCVCVRVCARVSFFVVLDILIIVTDPSLAFWLHGTLQFVKLALIKSQDARWR